MLAWVALGQSTFVYENKHPPVSCEAGGCFCFVLCMAVLRIALALDVHVQAGHHGKVAARHIAKVGACTA